MTSAGHHVRAGLGELDGDGPAKAGRSHVQVGQRPFEIGYHRELYRQVAGEAPGAALDRDV